MTKTWQTKKKILKLISKGAKTPGEISTELGLAPSTVSEHIEELEGMGAVEQVDNPFIKKWKYYRPNPNFDIRSLSGQRIVSNMPQIAAALAIVLGVLALFVFGMPAFGALGAGNSVVFSLTDPPSVPSGTQALNITYSSLQAHYVGAGNASAWVSGTGSGSLDLMTLLNTSQVIGSGHIPVNSAIDMIRFDITSAYIVINGTRYNVTVPSGQLTSPVTGGGKVTSNASVLIDLSPVVTTIYTKSSAIFVLVPSVKAVVVGNVSARIGERHTLTHQENDELNAATPQISITSDSFAVVSNSIVRLSITVKNNANDTVTLRHVLLMGIPSVLVSENTSEGGNFIANVEDMPPMMDVSGNGSFSLMAHGGEDLSNAIPAGRGACDLNPLVSNGCINGSEEDINGVHVMVVGNSAVQAHMPMMNADQTEELNHLVKVGAEVRAFRVLNFLVAADGELILPFVEGGCAAAGTLPRNVTMPCVQEQSAVGALSGTGYVLKPGASVTLTFSGSILYANNHLRITPVAGSNWRLEVSGDDGARATTNVTVV